MDETAPKEATPHPLPAFTKHRIARHLADELLRGRRFFKAKEIAAQVGATSRQVANHLRTLRQSSVFSISEQARSSHSTTWRIEFQMPSWEILSRQSSLLLFLQPLSPRRAAT